ncbi:MAG: hypothetical protein WBB28_24495 [Crinalium sp.]
MNLLETINRKLSTQNLSVKLRLNIEEKDIRAGKDWIYCNEAIKPILVLLEEDETVVLKADTWNTLLNKIESEYGKRFMRYHDLNSLREDRYNTTDREEDY